MGTGSGTKMRGLFKGIRYISHIFEKEEDSKDGKMQIGQPTNVKHVAHIGWDGPVINVSPDSINDPDVNAAGASAQKPTTSEHESSKVAGAASSRHTRRSESTYREGSVRRGQRSMGGRSSCECLLQDYTEGSRNGRKNRRTAENAAAAAVAEHSASNATGTSKHPHRRKAKGASVGASSTRSRNKAEALSSAEPPVPTIEDGSEEGERRREL